MSFKVYPYKQGSASAKNLATALDGKVLKVVGSKYKPKAGDTVVNWGASNPPAFGPARVLNRDVTAAQCKLKTFEALDEDDISIPAYTVDIDVAKDFVFPVVCRTKLRGHSGDGIVIAKEPNELVAAPLYTQYVKKKDEYRVHVFGDHVFFIQRKARKLDVELENVNWQIRNLAGGFVFVEALEADVPAMVTREAVKTIAALGLDFGGVDVMWNDNEKRAYVLEVNTACGLEERTALKYRDEILRPVAD